MTVIIVLREGDAVKIC